MNQLLVEHVAYYGEMLEIVFLAEVARNAFEKPPLPVALVKAINALLLLGNPTVRNHITLGFVQGVPLETQIGSLAGVPETALLRHRLRPPFLGEDDWGGCLWGVGVVGARSG